MQCVYDDFPASSYAAYIGETVTPAAAGGSGVTPPVIIAIHDSEIE